MNQPIFIQFYTSEDGEINSALIDVIDFHYICKQGLQGNTQFFDQLYNSFQEMYHDKKSSS